MRALLWPLFARSAWAQADTVVLGTTGEALLRPLIARSALVMPATVVAGTIGEGAALASDRLVGVDSASHCGGGNDRRGRCPGLCSLGRRGHSQPMSRRAREVRALPWPLISRSSWAQPATVVADTRVSGRCSGLSLLFRRGLSQTLWWRLRDLRPLVWPLFARSAWAQPVTVVASTTGVGAQLASVRSVGVGSASHCGGGHDSLASVRSVGVGSVGHCGGGHDT
jgi:hypothetical protein